MNNDQKLVRFIKAVVQIADFYKAMRSAEHFKRYNQNIYLDKKGSMEYNI